MKTVQTSRYTLTAGETVHRCGGWNNNTSVTYSAITGITETYKSDAATYYINPFGDSEVTIWAADCPLLGYGHYEKERNSRFSVRIVSDSGDVISDRIVAGKRNKFSVKSKYGKFRVEVTRYTEWADDFMWNSNYGNYCQISLKNAAMC